MMKTVIIPVNLPYTKKKCPKKGHFEIKQFSNIRSIRIRIYSLIRVDVNLTQFRYRGIIRWTITIKTGDSEKTKFKMNKQ